MTAVIEMLRRVPLWVWVVIVLAAGVGLQSHRLSAAHRELDAVNARWSAERASLAAAAASASENYRAVEAQRVSIQQEVSHVADLDQAHRRAAALAADDVARRLRQRVAAITAAGRCAAAADSVAAVSGLPASSPADLFPEVQRRIDEAAGIIADYADRAAIAGLACERSYSALTPP